jgi:hypothetical protein
MVILINGGNKKVENCMIAVVKEIVFLLFRDQFGLLLRKKHVAVCLKVKLLSGTKT